MVAIRGFFGTCIALFLFNGEARSSQLDTCLAAHLSPKERCRCLEKIRPRRESQTAEYDSWLHEVVGLGCGNIHAPVASMPTENEFIRRLHDDDDDDDDHHHHDPTETIGHKVGALLLMLSVAVFGCALPYWLQNLGVTKVIMPYINGFACGAFLGLAFFHLLPEAMLTTDSANIGFQVGKSWYNLTFILSFSGFMLIMICEKILLVGVATEESGLVSHGHGAYEEADRPIAQREATAACGKHCSDKEGPDTECCKEDPEAVNASATVAFSPAALFASLSLALHSIFEGIIVGMFEDAVTVWVASISISGHKWAAGFALAVNCINKRVTFTAAMIYLGIFIIASPIGVGIGIFASQKGDAIVGVVNALSLGTIFYTGCELLFDQFKGVGKVRRELAKFAFVILGAGVVLALMMLHLAKGGHTHGKMHAH